MSIGSRTRRQVGAIAAALIAPVASSAASSASGGSGAPVESTRCVTLVDLGAGACLDPRRLFSDPPESQPSQAEALASILATPVAIGLLVALLAAVIATWHVRIRALEIDLAKVQLREGGGSRANRVAARCNEVLVLLKAEEMRGDESVASAARSLQRACDEFKRAVKVDD